MIVARVAAIVAAGALAGGGLPTWRLLALQSEGARSARLRAVAMAAAERQARRSVEVVADETHRALARARADASAARDALDGLRDAAATAGACPGPSASPGGASAPAAGVVLADVLGSAAGRAVELAAALDAAHAAGTGCQQAFDAVTGRDGLVARP